jgi:hypothetical protein
MGYMKLERCISEEVIAICYTERGGRSHNVMGGEAQTTNFLKKYKTE